MPLNEDGIAFRNRSNLYLTHLVSFREHQCSMFQFLLLVNELLYIFSLPCSFAW